MTEESQDNSFDDEIKQKGYSPQDSNIKLPNKKTIRSILDSMKISILNNIIIENMVSFIFKFSLIKIMTFLRIEKIIKKSQ